MQTLQPLAGNLLGDLNTDFVIAEWEDAGGVYETPNYIAPLHLHRKEDEAWYVLEGTLCVRIGEKTFELPAGAGVIAPKGQPHTFWNPGPGRCRYLLIMRPETKQLIDEIHSLQDRNFDSLRALFERHDCELLGW